MCFYLDKTSKPRISKGMYVYKVLRTASPYQLDFHKHKGLLLGFSPFQHVQYYHGNINTAKIVITTEGKPYNYQYIGSGLHAYKTKYIAKARIKKAYPSCYCYKVVTMYIPPGILYYENSLDCIVSEVLLHL